MMKKDAYILWEQEGDLERMKLFFQEVRPDPDQKERIKKLAIEKIRKEEKDAASGETPRNILIPELPPKESLREKTRRNLKSFWWRWQWKLAVPIVAVLMIVFIGIGMEGLKDSPLGIGRGSMSKSSTQNSVAFDSVGVAGAPQESDQKSMEKAPSYSSNVAPDANFSMSGTADLAVPQREIAPIMPLPEPQVPPADEGLPKKITYNMNASLQVEDVSQALTTITQEIVGLGGYVVESSESNYQYDSSAYATFKIPSHQLEGFKDRLEQFGKVLNKNTSSDDITNQYYDTQSRLKSLESQEARYLEILREAKTVEEILHIESYLSSTRLQIEQLQGQVKLWDHQVAYSNVTVNFQTTPRLVNVNDPWQPVSWSNTWQAAKDAVLKTISSTWNGINYLVVGIAYALPYIIIVGVIIGIFLIKKNKYKSK